MFDVARMRSTVCRVPVILEWKSEMEVNLEWKSEMEMEDPSQPPYSTVY